MGVFFSGVEILHPCAKPPGPRGCEKIEKDTCLCKTYGHGGHYRNLQIKLQSRAQFVSITHLPGHGCVMIVLVNGKCPPCPYHPTHLIHNL
jgi:hypothetical protein